MLKNATKRKRKWWLITPLFFILLPTLVALRLRWFSSQGVILAGSSGRDIFGQCSREEPPKVSGFWCPYPWHVSDLESALPQFMNKDPNTIKPFILKDYYLQYSGIVRNGRYLIYANAFPRDTFGDNAFLWRLKSEDTCDGGPSFFGFEFEPATGQFGYLSFNNGSP